MLAFKTYDKHPDNAGQGYQVVYSFLGHGI